MTLNGMRISEIITEMWTNIDPYCHRQKYNKRIYFKRYKIHADIRVCSVAMGPQTTLGQS